MTNTNNRGCLLGHCPECPPEECRRCGFRSAVHDQRVNAIHKRGLRRDKETKLLYLPVRAAKKAR